MPPAVDLYDIVLLLTGLAVLGAAWLPRVVVAWPISLPILYVIAGMAVFSAPVGLIPPKLLENAELAERLSELVVILALMGAGLKLSRPVSWRGWMSTWRLLAWTMPLTIALVAAGGMAVGLPLASAALLGAALAPTDPVLASDVQAEGPHEPHTGEVRFALTSEAGLNDGLAFPFTHLAVWLALSPEEPWWHEWLYWDVAYRVAVGVVGGWLLGRAMAWLLPHLPAPRALAKQMEGSVALAVTLLAYAGVELLQGYGFLAVFVAAYTMQAYRPARPFLPALHDFAEDIERTLLAVLLVVLGGLVVGGALSDLAWPHVLLAGVIVLVIRPLCGGVAMLGSDLPRAERWTVSFFGIRGIGSIYYLCFGLNHAVFVEADILVGLVLLTILMSVTVHGVTATPWMRWVEGSGQAAGGTNA